MLLPLPILQGVVDGTIDRAYRRWDAARVKAGGRQRTAVGVIGFTSVEMVERDSLTGADAHQAGATSLAHLLAFLDRRPDRPIWRIGLALTGPDPRVELRDRLPTEAEHAEVERRLDRLDRASRHGPWTTAVLAAIGERPEVRAVDLAAGFGREKMQFKLDVRKLKELGLTESLPRGYRLSPRGRAVLDRRRPER